MKKTDSLEAQLIEIAVNAALDSLAKDWEKTRARYAQRIATVKAERSKK
jgi:hypothetical protein